MPVPTIPASRKDVYLRRVAQLYADVRRWVGDLDPTAQFAESEVEIVEEATGAYKASSLEVARPGRPALRFIPQGRYMIGAEGRVDVRSRLGSETLVWVRQDGPALGFRTTLGGDEPEELIGRPMFPGVAEGWAWSDEDRLQLVHLDRDVFQDRILNDL